MGIASISALNSIRFGNLQSNHMKRNQKWFEKGEFPNAEAAKIPRLAAN